MRRNRIFTLAAVVLGAAAILGCEARVYRAETVLHADGTVSRAIYQPLDATPDAARQRGVWPQATYADRVPHDKWTGPIDELPPAGPEPKLKYFAAWGQFESPRELPKSYVRKAAPGLSDGELVLEYWREDYGLVVDHLWTETLTDIVTLDDMHQARVELADLMIPLATETLAEALGEEYDTTRLSDWLEQTGRPWFYEMTDVVFDAAARGQVGNDKLLKALAPVCARWGLVLTNGAGQLLEPELMTRAVAAYTTKVLRDNLARRDGAEVSDQEIRMIVEWLGLAERPADAESRYRKYDEAAKKVVAKSFGDEETFGKNLDPLVSRILGLYAGQIFDSPHEFHYTLEMPGSIVKTNGTLLSDHQVRWTFEGDDAYPFGYAMECESLVVKGAVEEPLLGERVLDSREATLRYVELARTDPRLRQALRDCVAAESMKPFCAAEEAAPADSNTAKAFDAMRAFLQLPEKSLED